jgi:antitoxin component HigA of HigAB toxin-antitoxin module
MDIKPIRTEQDYDLACKRIEAIFQKIQMQNLGVSRKDLMGHLRKSGGRISDILNCRRRLTLADIRTLSNMLRVPIDVLSQDYPLEKARPNQSNATLKSVAHC